MTASNPNSTGKPPCRGKHRPRWRQRDLPRLSAVFPVLFTGLTLLLAVRASGGVVADLTGVGGELATLRPETTAADSACDRGDARESQPGPAAPRHSGPAGHPPSDSTAPGPVDRDDPGRAGTDGVAAVIDAGTTSQGHRSLSSPRERSVLQPSVCGSRDSDPARVSPHGHPAPRARPRRGLCARTPRAPRAPPGR
jgi:hypothetical protein